MSSGDQFAPIDRPYLKKWQERMGSVETPLVSKAVIASSDKLLADIEAKIAADPKLRKIAADTRREALAAIAKAKKKRKKAHK